MCPHRHGIFNLLSFRTEVAVGLGITNPSNITDPSQAGVNFEIESNITEKEVTWSFSKLVLLLSERN